MAGNYKQQKNSMKFKVMRLKLYIKKHIHF